MKRPPNEWEKIFANDISDKELISKIQKKTHTTQYKKTKQQKQNKTKNRFKNVKRT